MLDYQAQLLDLKADFGGPADGTVHRGRASRKAAAPSRNILVQEGKLKKGDFIVVGRAFGRVRDIVDDHGKRIDEAGPSMPVAISGINEVPDAGDKFYVRQEPQGGRGRRRGAHGSRSASAIWRRRRSRSTTSSRSSPRQDARSFRSSSRPTCRARSRRCSATLEKISTEEVTIADQARGRRRHQRVGHPARRGDRRDHHRLQRHRPRARPARLPKPRASTFGSTTSSTTSPTTSRRPPRACSSPSSSWRCSVTPRSARSSRSRRSA